MIPNIITTFRLFLVPLFAYFMLVADSPALACAVLITSGVSDVIDGFIARNFNMITETGKVYDPLVDKLMHITVVCALAAREFLPSWVIAIIIFKEIAMICVSTILYIKKVIIQARWYGKMATVAFYAVILMLVIFKNIPAVLQTVLLMILVATMLFAAVGYVTQLVSSQKRTSLTAANTTEQQV